MSLRRCITTATALLGGMTTAIAAGPTDDVARVAQGKAAFDRVCAACHAKGPGNDGAAMLPGAAALERRYKGAVSPYLEERGDLTAVLLTSFIRNGVGGMPMFRKTEISDREIEAIALYFSSNSAE